MCETATAAAAKRTPSGILRGADPRERIRTLRRYAVSLVIRRGGPQDARFLRDMLRHALYWRERVPGSLTSRYVRGWGRPEDTAVIALEGGFAVGAAWYRLFTEAEPGYGFVDESTPELAIAVVPSKRGRGIGEKLLTALMDRARASGYTSLSLSVEPENPSRKLYERHGFEVVDRGTEAWTMRARIASPTTSD